MITPFFKSTDKAFTLLKGDCVELLNQFDFKFDMIFADPPYDLPEIPEIHRLVFDNHLLKPGGLLIIEHGARTPLSHLSGFEQQRKYGNVNFSFFVSAE